MNHFSSYAKQVNLLTGYFFERKPLKNIFSLLAEVLE